ncbi:MAG: hypothetical protein GYB65_13585 [Chloroflexi bacterium]|nr:hypothetical protein [Chloroflexota bacterium]
MKKAMRWLAGVVVVVMVLGLIPTAQAQGGDEVFCGDLSDSDCALLRDAAANLEGLYSFEMPVWEVYVAGEVYDETAEFSATGSGAIIIPQDVAAVLSDLPEPDSMYDLDPVLTFLERVDGALFTQLVADSVVAFSIDEAGFSVLEEEMSGSVGLLWKDLGVYVYAESPNGAGAWFTDSLDREILEDAEFEIDDLLRELIVALNDEEVDGMLDELPDMSEYQERLNDLVEAHTTITRGDDQTLHGQQMATFVTNVDFKAMLMDPALIDLILDVLYDPALYEFTSVVEDEIGGFTPQQFELVFMNIDFFISQAEMNTVQWIGLDDRNIHLIGFEAMFTVDTEQILPADGFVAELYAGFYSEMDNINAVNPDDIVAPTAARPMSDMDDFMMGGSDLIEGSLRQNEPVYGELGYDNEMDVYSLTLRAGDAIMLDIDADDYDTELAVYGPDGFLVDDADVYYDESLEFTAQQEGMYLVVIENTWYWDEYMLTVSPQ